ncbi:hypothetical protein BACINT_03729 [Bacteroides intestinalis DSM 17393]|uniref:Uncharacterized protein n=1 Tax=Bacteroides intestinalis DSM 17393 TaxID=471870 RepID=B3CC82_9BACE|nr:hypothetical protein BACINT_03729 [Bacteroides intestinalis DSM 17393]
MLFSLRKSKSVTDGLGLACNGKPCGTHARFHLPALSGLLLRCKVTVI